MCKFEELLKLNVNGKVEKRKGDNGKELSYLSWAFAWGEFKKVYPEATYEIIKYSDGERLVPYMYDPKTGYMVQTAVTAEGITHEMWLPVMNSVNKAMKAEPYEYTTKNGTKSVEAATMFDINKAIMRCLVKNLAMFGLGLYIYAGEDLPEQSEEPKENHDNEIFEMINDFTEPEELKKFYVKYSNEVTDIKTFTKLVRERGKKLIGE